MSYQTTFSVLREIMEERIRQDGLKAEGRFKYTCADIEMTNLQRLTVLLEEVGEAARAALEMHNLSNDVHGLRHGLRKEMIQVAAVAVAFVEGLDEDSHVFP